MHFHYSVMLIKYRVFETQSYNFALFGQILVEILLTFNKTLNPLGCEIHHFISYTFFLNAHERKTSFNAS